MVSINNPPYQSARYKQHLWSSTGAQVPPNLKKWPLVFLLAFLLSYTLQFHPFPKRASFYLACVLAFCQNTRQKLIWTLCTWSRALPWVSEIVLVPPIPPFNLNTRYTNGNWGELTKTSCSWEVKLRYSLAKLQQSTIPVKPNFVKQLKIPLSQQLRRLNVQEGFCMGEQLQFEKHYGSLTFYILKCKSQLFGTVFLPFLATLW